ncbi:hypothetical protein ASG25_02140 [Rhizobium sp. Leaf384]|uniref:hypothetical protein n=1 Tax=unclassified Rhizobium TaxID=2613769 RepID=UPI000715616B|nr:MULTISPECIES: hypothetical protein [unclassified Rhizobium]KQS80433.1 hypothetical protein ASG25_02140 [Rhizobium sp. Leaf384]KQS86482.1 hypothetical protein ASG58_17205 [Rhizobium sp. Leaf383]
MTNVQHHANEPLEMSIDVLAEHIITEHAGDAVEAVKTLVMELDFTRDQLQIASRLLSTGIGRGWKPRLERLPARPEA